MLADLDQAITVGRQAVDAIPSDHPGLSGCLFNLGLALTSRFGRTGALADLDQATAAYTDALHVTTAGANVRARAGRRAARLGADQGDWSTAQAVLKTVIGLLPTLTDHALSPQDRQHHLTQLQGLGADAVRATLGPIHRDHAWPDRVATAWQHFEQSRTVLLSQALEIRHNIDLLHNTRPDLASEFEQLRHVLTDGTGASVPSATDLLKGVSHV